MPAQEHDRRHLYVDGEWEAPLKGTAHEVVEAATGRAFAVAALASTDDVDLAVAAARRALLGPWARFEPAERARLLTAFAGELKARRTTTSALVSRENGMPITLSRVVNGAAPAYITEYYAGLAAAMTVEERRPSPTGGHTLVVREPVGVVAAVTPWNYPQSLAIVKVAPALAAGCTVVLKPPPEAALDAFVLADAAEAAGVPAGVLNIVPGGRVAGAHLVGHPGVDKVAFTGSTGAGRAIGGTAGRLLRSVTLELGGKSVSLLAEDADLEPFTDRLLEVSLPNNGQTCHAATRILAPRRRYDEVVEAVTAKVVDLRVGDPLDRETEVGPLVSAAQRDRVLGHVAQGKASARLTTGGGVPRRPGWFVEPTVFAEVDNSSVIAREEIFGPVLCVLPYDDEEHALALANDSDFGLGGVVWSADAEHGLSLARRIRSGTVGVNHYELHINAPFGGVKASGVGRELGPEGIEPYVVPKSIYLR
jgi:aldehyde dehydrogenase (NAD+)